MKRVVLLILLVTLGTASFAAKKSIEGGWKPLFTPTSTSIPAVQERNRKAAEKEKNKNEASQSEKVSDTATEPAVTVDTGDTTGAVAKSGDAAMEVAADNANSEEGEEVAEEEDFPAPPDLTDELVARLYMFDATDYKGKIKRSVRLVNMTRGCEGKEFYVYYYFGPSNEDWEYYGTGTLQKYYTMPRVESPYNKKLFEIRYFVIIPKDEGNYRYEIKKQKKDLLILVYDENEAPLSDDEKKSATVIDSATIDGKFKNRIAFKSEQEVQPLKFWVYGFNEAEGSESDPSAASDGGEAMGEAVVTTGESDKNASAEGDSNKSEDKASEWQLIGAAKLFENGSSDIVQTPLKKKAVKFSYYAVIDCDKKDGYTIQAQKLYGDLVIKVRDPKVVEEEEAKKAAELAAQSVEVSTSDSETTLSDDGAKGEN